MSGEEVRDLGANLDFLASASGRTRDEIEKTLQTGDKVTRKLEANLASVHKKLSEQSVSLEKQISSLNEKIARGQELSQEEFARLGHLKSSRKEIESQISSVDKFSNSQKDQGGETLKVVEVFKSLGSALMALTGIVGILNLAWELLTKAFKVWLGLQEKTVVATGELNRSLGATANQSRLAAAEATTLYDTFSRLEGSVDGIAESSQFIGDLKLALRDTSETTEQYKKNVLALNRGLGMSVEQVTQFEATAKSAFGMDLETMSGRMLDFAEDAGIPGSVIAKGMSEAESDMAQFGKEGPRVFEKVSLFAKKLRTNVGKIFEGMKKFDFFDQATESINQLNTMMGTSISSFEMLMIQDPSERLEKIRSELMAQGHEWQNMTRYQKMAVAQTVGLTEAETSRLFETGMSLKNLEEEQEKAAKKREQAEGAQQDNQIKLNKLLERSSIVFESLGRMFDRIWIHVARKLGPIFSKVFGAAQDGVATFGEIIDKIIESEGFTKFVESIAGAIERIVKWVKEIDWETAFQKAEVMAGEFLITIKELAGAIKDIGKAVNDLPFMGNDEWGLDSAASFGSKIAKVDESLGTQTNAIGKVDPAKLASIGGKKGLSESQKDAFAELSLNKRISYRGVQQTNPSSSTVDQTNNADMYAAGRNREIIIRNEINMKGDVNIDGRKMGNAVGNAVMTNSHSG